MARGYDVIGSKGKAVAIIEVRDEDVGAGAEKELAKAIMARNKHIVSVLKKESAREGEFRIREYSLIAGDENTEVLHMENGYKLLLDPQLVYFSNRESTERMRIASQVHPGELVMVMFGGVAPFPISIAKIQPDVNKIYSIELNPIAHKYALDNVRINKLSHKIIPICGNVREVCPKLGKKFDRIVMPLPKEAYEFLDIAISCLRRGGIIHLYYWSSEPDLFSEAEKLIKNAAEKLNKKIKILDKKKVLPYGPKKWKIVLDFIVS